jgi:eukaryotic-like serine/threonine-protein kinase
VGYRRGVTDPRDPAVPRHLDGDGARLIGDRYRLGPVIGRGGMATIHRAIDTRSERAVAVKLLRPEVSRDPDLAQRFRREALAATVLRHPNIVACLDTGTDGDQPYLVMELIEGEDLAARLKRSGRLAAWQVARIGLDVAHGLGVAHTRGIVHRDIKPSNILLAADGRAMVADFGIARLAIDTEAALPGTTLGSVHYFSPEQARGLTTTPASDVYGLGLVLYEALTGQRAWTGDTTDAIALARVGAAPPSPSARVAGVPEALEIVVQRALAPEPADRYPTGVAIAAALVPIVTATERSRSSVAIEPAGAAAAADVIVASRPAVADGGPGASNDPTAAPPLVPAGAEPSPSGSAAPSVWSAWAMAALRTLDASRVPRSARSGLALGSLAIAGLVLGAILVAALPGGEEAALSSARPRPSPTAVAARATDAPPDPTATAASTDRPEPTPSPTPRRSPPPGRVSDLCESYFGLACGLDAGRYAPTRFDPAFDIKLGDGWSNARHEPDVVVLSRDEGSMTFVSHVRQVYPGGAATTPEDTARSIIEAMVVTDGISSTKPAAVRIGKRKGFSIDVSPLGDRRVRLFRNGSSSFVLSPGQTTRVVVIDVRGTAVVLTIEPTGQADLRAILDTADDAAGTIRWR